MTVNGDGNPLAKLELPRRWELLQKRAQALNVDPTEFVERVDAAAERIDKLLARLRTGGGGLFEVVLGLSGSGKTTFLQTLPRFFNNIRVCPFARTNPLLALPKFITSTYVAADTASRIVLVERRDNPSAEDIKQVAPMFAELLETFRSTEGSVLVLWPVTDAEAANNIAASAWATGRDSMVDPSTQGLLGFKGLPKERYRAIADLTSRNLAGDGLDAFGITLDVANTLLPKCDTISDFFHAVDSLAEEKRGKTWSVLRERVRARLWVVLPGDLTEAINATSAGLTQGTRNRIDIDLIGEFIDREDNKSIYVEDWRKRRGSMAHLLRAIDVRLFPLPPNVALAAVRAFGDESLKALLKQPAVNLEHAKETMKASRLYKAILSEAGITTTPFAGSRGASTETENEYRRVQTTASKNDKPLNKALGLLIEACLADDAPGLKVVSEKKALPGSELRPDVQVQLGATDFICLEPTWRSSDAGIEGELEGGQNTLSEAHMKKYVLDKASQYVKDLGL